MGDAGGAGSSGFLSITVFDRRAGEQRGGDKRMRHGPRIASTLTNRQTLLSKIHFSSNERGETVTIS